MTDLQDVIAALVADGDDIDRLVANLGDAAWSLPTPAPGWTIKHQIAHLIATFKIAGLAARDPGAFGALAARLSDDFDANVHATLNPTWRTRQPHCWRSSGTSGRLPPTRWPRCRPTR